MVPLLDKLASGELELSDLWTPHNEHRMLVPRLVMLGLALMTHYNNLAEMYVTLAVFGGALGVLLLRFTDTIAASTSARLLLFAPISFLLFSPRQWENWLLGILVQFALVLAFSILTLHFLQSSIEGRKLRARTFVPALLSAMLASFSSVHGLMVWPAGVVQLLMTPASARAKRSAVAVWALAGVATWSVYFIGYRAPQYAGAEEGLVSYAIKHPLQEAEFFLVLLGSSLSWWHWGSFASGLLLIGVLSLGLLIVYRTRTLNECRFWLALLCFSFLVLAAITVGRTPFEAEFALSSRYAAYSIPVVVCAYVLLVKAVSESRSHLSAVVLGVLALTVGSSIPVSYWEGVEIGRAQHDFREKSAFVLYTHETQPAQTLHNHLCPVEGCYSSRVKPGISILERLNYNVFAEPRDRFLPPRLGNLSRKKGTALTSSYVTNIDNSSASRSNAAITVPETLSFVRISGWAVDPETMDPARGVYIRVDGHTYPARYGIRRENLIERFDAVRSHGRYGFERDIPVSAIAAGTHEVKVIVVSSDGRSRYAPKKPFALEVDE